MSGIILLVALAVIAVFFPRWVTALGVWYIALEVL